MRVWLYKKNVEATIFTGEEAVNQALENGWQDTPVIDARETIVDAVIINNVNEFKEDAEEAIEAIEDIQESELDELSKDDLLVIAEEEGLNVPMNIKKDVLIAKINASRE